MDACGSSDTCSPRALQSHFFLDIHIIPTASTHVLFGIWPSHRKSMCALDHYTGTLPLTIFDVALAPTMYNNL